MLQYTLKVYQSSRQSNYAFAFYNASCKMCEKNSLTLNEERNEEIKPDFEGLDKFLVSRPSQTKKYHAGGQLLFIILLKSIILYPSH